MEFAPFWARLIAYLLDGMVLLALGLLFLAVAGLQLLLASNMGEVDPPEASLWAFVAILGFYCVFTALYYIVLWAWRGQTIGKMAMGLRVVTKDGRRPGLGRSSLRWVGYILSAMPLLLGYVWAAVDKENRALHDYLAGTRVVR